MTLDLSSHRINALALAPGFPQGGAVYAATDMTLLRSDDGGRTWQDALQVPLGEQALNVLAALVTQKGTLLAGVSGGILRSKDKIHWESVPFSTPLPVITALVEIGSGSLLAGTAQDGVYQSQDGGAHWMRWNFGLLDGHVYSLLAGQPGGRASAFAGVETGVFYSSNNGRAWRETDFPMEEGPVLSLCALEGRLFAGTESGKVFRSDVQGREWQPVGQGLFPAEVSALAVRAGRTYVASGDQVWVSPDGGESWQAWQSPQPVQGSFLCLAAGNGAVLAGTSAGQVFWVSGAG